MMYHVFFIYSPAHEHLGYFHALVIANNATVNIGVTYVFLNCGFSHSMCPVVGLLDHMVVLFLALLLLF